MLGRRVLSPWRQHSLLLVVLLSCWTRWVGIIRAAAVAEQEASTRTTIQSIPRSRILQSVTEQRKQEYINLALANYPPIMNEGDRDNSLPIWPFINQPLPEGSFDVALARIVDPTLTVGDMDLTQLVRVLYLSDATQQAAIQTRLQALYDAGQLRFWLQQGETHSTYWTENHMIMWLSCTLLLQPWLTFRSGDDAIDGLQRRLHHYLDVKIEYGLYEFYSTVYYKFTLGSLLNLIDFAVDASIAAKAKTVFDKTMAGVLQIATTEGFYYPPAARNPQQVYNFALQLDMVWFFTGTGVIPSKADFLGAFLATSGIDLEPIAATLTPTANAKFEVGHAVADLKRVHDSLPKDDRILHQWTAGAAVDKKHIADSRYLVNEYRLFNHKLLGDIGGWTKLLFFDPLLMLISGLFSGQTEGSIFTGAKVTVFKDHGVALTSLEDYNVGDRGADQWPWCATVADVAVFTQSGISGRVFQPALGFSNTHLPQVKQDGNVALISYRPKKEVYFPEFWLNLFGVDYQTRVGLRFPDERFDEVTEEGRWVFGRKGDNYIGVWRHSLDKNDCSGETEVCREYYFSDPKDGCRQQVWAAVVGNTNTHGSFAAFRQVVAQGTVEANRPNFLSWFFGFTYETSLQVDGKSLSSRI